jgi:hypothetical protein
MTDDEFSLTDIARDMSLATDVDFTVCHRLLHVVTDQPFEGGLFHLEIDDDKAKSISLRHVRHNLGNLAVLDVVAAMATLGGFIDADRPLKYWINGALALVFVARALQKVVTVEFDEGHSAVLVALHHRGGKQVGELDLRSDWEALLTQLAPSAPNTSQKRFKASLTRLAALGVIKPDRDWSFAEEVREKR